MNPEEVRSCGVCYHANLCRQWYRISAAISEPMLCGWRGVQPRLEQENRSASLRARISEVVAAECERFEVPSDSVD